MHCKGIQNYRIGKRSLDGLIFFQQKKHNKDRHKALTRHKGTTNPTATRWKQGECHKIHPRSKIFRVHKRYINVFEKLNDKNTTTDNNTT